MSLENIACLLACSTTTTTFRLDVTSQWRPFRRTGDLARSSTPRLVSAARVGPVVYGLLLTFRGDGYG